MSFFDEINDLESEEFIQESAEALENIPYLKYMRRKVLLPKGKPAGRGNMCLLYSKDISNSVDMMTNTTTLDSRSYYQYYYMHPLYSGILVGKKYIIRYKDDQKKIYERIRNEFNLKKTIPYPRKLLNPDSENRSIFIDLSVYLKIFFDRCNKFPPHKFVRLYWEYLKKVLNPYLSSTTYSYKFMLVDISQFDFSSKLQNNLRNPLFLIYYTNMKNFSLMSDLDLDIYFFVKNKRSFIRVNPSKMQEKSFKLFRMEMRKLLSDVDTSSSSSSIDDGLDEEKILDQEVVDTAAKEVLGNIASDDKIDDKETKLNKEIEKKVTSIAKTVQNKVVTTPVSVPNTTAKHSGVIKTKEAKPVETKTTTTTLKKVIADNNSSDEKHVSSVVKQAEEDVITKIVKDKTEEEINDDKALLDKIYKDIQAEKPVPTFSSQRDKMLREEQSKIKVGNTTIGELRKIQANNIPIPTRDVSNVVKGINESVKIIKYENFEKEYNQKLMKKDIVDSIMSLNDKSLPLYILKIDVNDTSDELNYKDTYTILLEDSNRKRHTVKVDIPKFLEDKFLFIGGNKKSIKKQSFFYPVVKVNENTVHVSTNYNKIIIERYDRKGLSPVERFKKILKKSEKLKSYCVFGNGMVSNKDIVTTIEYDDLSKFMTEFKTDKVHIVFDQTLAKKMMESKGIKSIDGALFIGFLNNNPVFINWKTQVDSRDRCIIDIMMEGVEDELKQEYLSTKPPKVNAFAGGTIMSKYIKIGILLAFWGGLSHLLKTLKVDYRLESKVPKELPSNEDYIVFKDCVLVYKTNTTIALLLNGLTDLDTASEELLAWDKRETYAPYILKKFGAAQKENALANFYEFMIDPITLEILKDLSLPEDIISLIIYAVSLLGDSQYVPEINQGQGRIRSNEVIPAILYDSIAKNYVKYRNSNGRKKFSIPQNEVIQKLLKLNTVENYSTLNPFLEMNILHSVSTRGFRGANLDEAYTTYKRSYDKSMIGTMGVESSPDGNIGVSKYLSIEPQVTNLRGYVDTPKSDKDLDKYDDVNIFSPTELSVPMSMSLDDATRSGHNVKQSSHIIPVKNSSPVLITNGFDESARFHLSNDFVVNAEEDGEIIDYDEKSNIMIAKYKSGKVQAIDLSANIVKNSGGGFFLSNILVTDLKVGDKFKENSVLAYHKDFFTNNQFNNCRMNVGTLTKVALMSTYNTYQDGTFITHKLSEDAATEMCFQKSVVIGKNANVEYIVNKGDKIEIGESLIRFDTSYEDDSLNMLLANMSGENKEALLANSKNNVQSKYSGVIEDIKIYAAVDLDEMSPSLKSIVQKYYKKINDKKKFLEKYDPESKNSIVKCGILVDQTSHKIKPNMYGVIKGENVEDAVLIEFYIKHSEQLEIGSKIACYSALKNTVDELIEEGYEPYSDFRPEEEIGTIIASNSILKRMTPSIIYAVFGYKCIVELKRSLKKLWDKKATRDEIQKLIFDFFTVMDKDKYNISYYRKFFTDMSETGFKNYMTAFFKDENAYLPLTVIDFKCPLTMEEIEAGAKLLNVPLYEYVSMPHITMDKRNVVVTREPVPVGYLLIKRP